MIHIHPGTYLSEMFLEPFGITQKALSKALDVSEAAVSRLISEKSVLTPEMALRLEKVVGLTAESWLELQAKFSVAEVRAYLGTLSLEKIDFSKLTPK